MPSELPRVEVRFIDQSSYERIKKRAADTGVSVSAFLLLCAGEPYPERGYGMRRDEETKKKRARKDATYGK